MKKGQKARCQFWYWLFLSQVLANQRWIFELLANTNHVEQGKCICIYYAGSLGRQNIFIVNRIFTWSYTNMAFVLIKHVLGEPSTNFWASARNDICFLVNSVRVWVARWLLFWRWFCTFTEQGENTKAQNRKLLSYFGTPINDAWKCKISWTYTQCSFLPFLQEKMTFKLKINLITRNPNKCKHWQAMSCIGQ